MKREDLIDAAVKAEKLLPEAAGNLREWMATKSLPAWAHEAMDDLLQWEAWDELNDRFYQNIAFGTGGMRGRTMGRIPAAVEVDDNGRALRAGVGANMMNRFNVIRGTMGLYRYARAFLEGEGRGEEPAHLVIAHDVRFFSREFGELAASTWIQLGGRVGLFSGPRSTPHLSFAVRVEGATCGVVITASHNPPHDNGYKCYFADGGQIVSPHAEGIIEAVNAVGLAEVVPFEEVDLRGVEQLDDRIDPLYEEALLENLTDPGQIGREKPRVVFTPIHGTGAITTVPLLRRLGAEVVEVEAQMEADGAFPTVKSPNPENAEALALALEKADQCGASLLMGTDPDADRMGVAVRNDAGEMVLLTGNQIGSLLAEFRIQRLFEEGILTAANASSAVLIKTFVTTPLQAKIARAHGLVLIETLTGFKYIGEKLTRYENQLLREVREKEGRELDYNQLPLAERRDLLLRYSRFYVFGGEESYGYLASDRVRDKDANAACLLFCELAAYLQSQAQTFTAYLDDLYRRYGYHHEALINLTYEGAAGAAKIARILKSYREDPPREMGGVPVIRFQDFGREDIHDADGCLIPKQDFYRLELEDGSSFAVRGSGTEPKIKFYTFSEKPVGDEADSLDAVKAAVAQQARALGRAIREDADQRAED